MAVWSSSLGQPVGPQVSSAALRTSDSEPITLAPQPSRRRRTTNPEHALPTESDSMATTSAVAPRLPPIQPPQPTQTPADLQPTATTDLETQLFWCNAAVESVAEGFDLRELHLRHPDAPSLSTITQWLKDPPWPSRLREARIAQAGHMIEEVTSMVRAATTSEDIARARLMFDVQKWRASKQAPAMWGDQLQVQISGPDVKAMTDEQLRELVASAMPNMQRILQGTADEVEYEDLRG